jgi:hypothetical protein
LEELSSADLRASDLLRERVEGLKAFRYASPKGGDAYKYRDTPHLFRPNKKRPKVPYVCLPGVVSTNRLFFTVAYLEAEVIASNAVFTAEDPDGFAFAIASSSMFITWLRLVGGKLKSDLRFSNTVVWNNFPLPHIDGQSRLDIANAGKAILEYRREHPNRSLADLYDPMVADPKLLSIHTRLDRAVDKAFGHDSPLASNSDREILLKRAFLELTAGT